MKYFKKSTKLLRSHRRSEEPKKKKVMTNIRSAGRQEYLKKQSKEMGSSMRRQSPPRPDPRFSEPPLLRLPCPHSRCPSSYMCPGKNPSLAGTAIFPTEPAGATHARYARTLGQSAHTLGQCREGGAITTHAHGRAGLFPSLSPRAADMVSLAARGSDARAHAAWPSSRR